VRLATAAAALLLAAGCPRETTSPSSGGGVMNGQELRIEESTQARASADLLVGAGNFWEEEGRLTCGLWFHDGSGDGGPEHVRVRAGQVLERAGLRIEVADVTRQGGKGIAVLKVSRP